ncbi:ABC transporter substrate-binding protein [Pseudomonas tumuqii]|uniref:ABC transporter substrate-binding protein n=1 Tax=Pseudomonas tumuqii TaxID=2715755 RepID=UPI0015580290|nr:ABC transporter substrate-binding protein [Pseudomonas tumuqii]
MTLQPTASLSPLKLAGGALGFNWLPVFVARERGIFERHGLAVELCRLGSVDKATAAVRSGEADLAISPPEGVLADAAACGSLRLIAANCNCLPLTLVARAGIERIEDLKGTVLGTSSLTEGTAIYTREMLAQHGLQYPQDYSFSLAGVHQARWKALQDGSIDAAVQPPPFNFLAIDAGYSDLGEVSDYLPEIAFTALLGRLEWVQAHEVAVLALLRALAEATALVYDESNDAMLVPIMMEVTQSDAAYAKRALDYMRDKSAFARSLEIPSAALDKSLELMVKAGLLDAAAQDSARRGWDGSWAQRATQAVHAAEAL